MRKYQQLLLFIVSCVSVGVLFMYKTENNRLKDVLHVINFFGRNDAAIFKKYENNASMNYLVDYQHPMAVWQAVGDSFHGYSAYWKRNELVAGGEALVLVAGRKGTVLNFKCSLNFRGNQKNIQGKFRFQRIDKDGEDDNSDFTRYNFYCRVTRDFGLPEFVTFVDLTSSNKDGHTLKLRHVKRVDKVLGVQSLTVCVDLVNKEFLNTTVVDKQDSDLSEFFLHHFFLGVDYFIVYNSDYMSPIVEHLLNRLNIRFHTMPFNFPYSAKNATERIRSFIEIDCLLRSTNRARYCLLLAANEYFYSNTKLENEKSIIRSLSHYSNDITRFNLQTFAICKNEIYNHLFENTMYDPELMSPHAISLFRPLDTGIFSSVEQTSNSPRQISLPLSQVFIHRYVNCVHIGKDGLHDWRNSLREEFMQQIKSLNQEIKTFI